MLLFAVFLFSLALQNPQEPLPDLQTFLSELRKSLHTDDLLLSSYTYTEKRTRVELDSNGRPRKTEVNVFEVIPGSCERPEYRRQIIKDGKQVSPKELDKQDREHRKAVESGRKGNRSGPRWRRRDACDDKASDEKITADLFNLYDIRIAGRETVAGHPALLVTFKPRTDYKPKTDQGKMLQKVAGRAWVSEEDYQLARVEAEVIDDISVLSFFAKLRKGTQLRAERRKFNDEVWLPSRAEVEVSARFLLRGVNARETIEYSDHRKFSVDTILSFPDIEEEEKD